MIEFRAEVWGWVVQSATEFSASSLNVKGFQVLNLAQRHDLAAKYLEMLGIDGASMVSAQGEFVLTDLITTNLSQSIDQSQSKFETPVMLERPVKEIVASILESVATDRVINALNMPSSASHPDMEIYRWGF